MICLNLPFYFSEIVESKILKRKSNEIEYYLIKSLMISIQTGISNILNFSWRDKSFNQSFRAGTTHNTLEASNDVHDLLAGCSYVSPNLIPLEIRQKPAPAKHRNLEQRFKVNSKCKNLYNFTDYLG